MYDLSTPPTPEELKTLFTQEELDPQAYDVLRKLAKSKNNDIQAIVNHCRPFLEANVFEFTDEFFAQEVKEENLFIEVHEDLDAGVFLVIDKELDPYDLSFVLLIPPEFIEKILPPSDTPLEWKKIVENYKHNRTELGKALTGMVTDIFSEELSQSILYFQLGLSNEQIFNLMNNTEAVTSPAPANNAPKPRP